MAIEKPEVQETEEYPQPMRIVMIFKGVEEGNPILNNVIQDLIAAAVERGLFFEHVMGDAIPDRDMDYESEFGQAFLGTKEHSAQRSRT